MPWASVFGHDARTLASSTFFPAYYTPNVASFSIRRLSPKVKLAYRIWNIVQREDCLSQQQGLLLDMTLRLLGTAYRLARLNIMLCREIVESLQWMDSVWRSCCVRSCVAWITSSSKFKNPNGLTRHQSLERYRREYLRQNGYPPDAVLPTNHEGEDEID